MSAPTPPDPHCAPTAPGAHRCNYSPTGYCRADIPTCAKTKGCIMPEPDEAA